MSDLKRKEVGKEIAEGEKEQKVVITDERHKLPAYSKGFAIIGFLDASCYDFFTEFGLYFVTSMGKLHSGIAGIIISIGTLMNAVLSPILGYVSDNSTAKMGRRRAYIFWGGIGCIVALPLMLIPMPFGQGAKIVFYGLAIILYWVAYAFFFTPYLAYGADISSGYDERSNLRTWVTMCNNTGTLAAYSGITAAVGVLMALGLTEHMSYFISMLCMCMISLVCLIVGIKITKGHDKVIPKASKEKLHVAKFIKGLLISYGSALKLKSMRIMIFIILFSIIGYMVKTNCELFLITENCGMGAGTMALYFLMTSLFSLIRPIPTKWFCDWLGKKGGFLLCVGLYLASAVFYAFYGINSLSAALVYAVFNGFILSGYWQIIPAMVYDIVDVDKYFYNKEREGTLVSFQALVESLGGAIAATISGVCLAIFGINEAAAEAGEAISSHAMDGILYMSTVIPGIFFIIASILVIIFPINKKRHDKIREANAKGIHAYDNDPEYEDLKVMN